MYLLVTSLLHTSHLLLLLRVLPFSLLFVLPSSFIFPLLFFFFSIIPHLFFFFFFFLNDPAPPEIYPLSLHDALPILVRFGRSVRERQSHHGPSSPVPAK